MAGAGRARPKTNWSLAIQATMAAFTILVMVLGAAMAYAYLNGSTAQQLRDHERRIGALERRESHE